MNGVLIKPLSRDHFEEAVRHDVADGCSLPEQRPSGGEHFPLAIVVLDLDLVTIVEDTDERLIIEPKAEAQNEEGEK